MTKKSKASEFDKAIKEKRAELEEVQQAMGAAVDSPEGLVLAEKQERRIIKQINALESARAAATYRPPEPTDRDELLQGFRQYAADKAEKVRKVQEAISEAEREQREIDLALQQAAEDCDAEKTVELSGKKSESESKLQYLHEMRDRVATLPAFPDGAAAQEWAAICEKVVPDWKRAVSQVEALAAGYKAACRDLLAMHDTLKAVRDDLKRIAEAEGYAPPVFSPVFTVGLEADKLTVTKADYIRLAGIGNPFTGEAL